MTIIAGKSNGDRHLYYRRSCKINVPVPLCAVKRRRSSGGAIPPRQLSLQPVAIEAVVEATIRPKPSMERILLGFREQAGRNVQ